MIFLFQILSEKKVYPIKVSKENKISGETPPLFFIGSQNIWVIYSQTQVVFDYILPM
jgi:hypothetical protein